MLHPVVEIYGPVIQGEGVVIGHKTIFVRLGGCDYRCKWCDSMFAVDPAQVKVQSTMMSSDLIVDHVRGVQHSGHCNLVTLSGGNPCIHDLTELVALLGAEGYLTCVETQGSRAPSWLAGVSIISLSPKPPSSGQVTDLYATKQLFSEYLGKISVKVVVFTESDFDYALDAFNTLSEAQCFFIQVGTVLGEPVEDTLERFRQVSSWLIDCDNAPSVRVLPQLHVLAWGHGRRV